MMGFFTVNIPTFIFGLFPLSRRHFLSQGSLFDIFSGRFLLSGLFLFLLEAQVFVITFLSPDLRVDLAAAAALFTPVIFRVEVRWFNYLCLDPMVEVTMSYSSLLVYFLYIYYSSFYI